ncbi:endo-1,4-beta-xylanase [Sphingomonas sanguinis]|uniref:endo-1,4-beta-xylanase n=1 Tax=Sphingomonas sanguinis TaxID=33051 RepID=UPI001C575407|nr:endo-1,4-beta-xylanase [Sphingomonas sanguinis]QXT36365.1 endo-1,4-beta-xylanase [Sphingomonas sanguinis]
MKPKGQGPLLTRRQQLVGIAGGLTMGALPKALWAAEDNASLRNLAAQKGVLFGTAINAGRGSPINDPGYGAIVARECAVLVPENEMKVYVLGNDPAHLNFGPADRIAGFARDNRMKLRGHTLLWNYEKYISPALAETVTKTGAEKWLRSYIAAVAGHFGDQIYSWDVVNETIDPKTGEVRGTVFDKALGFDVFKIAYEAAREHAPHAQRVYNDYMSWEVGNETHRAGVLRLLERFRKENVPVDALGIQSHLGNDGSHSKVQRAEWKRFLDSVTAMGYRLLITEFDINDREMAKDITQRDAQVASVAKSYLDMMLSYPQLDQLLCWGLWDKHSWLNGFAPRADGLPQRPLPYDDALKPKPMRAAIADALRAAPVRKSIA